MAKKAKKTKKKSSRSTTKKKSPKKTSKKTKKKKPSAKKIKRTPIKKPKSRPKPKKVVAKKPTNEDILEKYSKEVGMNYEKPKSIADFDKHLEETARLISGSKESKHELPQFSDDHMRKAEEKENEMFNVNPQKEEPKKEPEKVAPEPEEKTLSSKHSHPYTEQKTDTTSSLWDQHPSHSHHENLPSHHKKAINGIVFAFVGVIVPIFSIVGLIVSIRAAKHGSNTGMGAALLSFATFIINLVLIYLFYDIVIVGSL